MHFAPATLLGAALSVLPLSLCSPVPNVDIVRRVDSPVHELKEVVHFGLDIVSVMPFNTTVYRCDSAEAGCVQSRSEPEARQLGEPVCPQGTIFIDSTCATSVSTEVHCLSSTGAIKTIYFDCPATQVCIHRGRLQHDSRGRCIPSDQVVTWEIFSPSSIYSQSVTVTAPYPDMAAGLVNNYYSISNVPGGDGAVSVYESAFFINGSIPAGDVFYARAAESDIVDWDEIQSMKSTVTTLQARTVTVFTFLSEQIPVCFNLAPMDLTGTKPFPGVSTAQKSQYIYVWSSADELRKRDDVDSTTALSTHAIVPRNRNFENPYYRLLARGVGVFMISTSIGLLIDTVTFVDELPMRSWAGDHILELAQFENWLSSNNPAVLDAILSCDVLYNRFTTILNSPGNLVGVDGLLNNLKMVLLQTNGPTDWTRYNEGIYLAMNSYFVSITPNYEYTASRLAGALDNVASSMGFNGVGAAFQTFVIGRLVNAQALVTAHLAGRPPGLGGNYVLQQL